MDTDLSDLLFIDQKDYHEWALEISKGLVWVPEIKPGMPLYAYFSGLIYFFSPDNLAGLRIIQSILGAVNCVLVYYLASKVFTRRVYAATAYLLGLGFKLSVFYEHLVIAVTLMTTLLILLLLSIIRAENTQSKRWYVISGVILGAAIATRANAVFIVPVLILRLFFLPISVSDKFKKNICILSGIISVLIPIWISNYSASKDFVPLTFHSGFVFHLGNGPYSDGRFVNPPPGFPADRKEKLKYSVKYVSELYNREVRPSESSRYWYLQTFDHILSHPQSYLKLMVKKSVLLVCGFEMSDIMSYSFESEFNPSLHIFPFSLLILSPLGFASVILYSRKDRNVTLIMMIFLSYSVSAMFGLVAERYKVPLYPYYVILSVYSVKQFLKLRLSLLRKFAAGMFIISVLALSSDPSFIQKYSMVPGAFSSTLGAHYIDNRNYDKALYMLQRSIEESDGNHQFILLLAHLYEVTGEKNKAYELVEKSFSSDADNQELEEYLNYLSDPDNHV